MSAPKPASSLLLSLLAHKILFLVGAGGLLVGCHKAPPAPAPPLADSWHTVPVTNGRPPISALEAVRFSSASVGWIIGGIDLNLAGHPVLLKTVDAGQSWTSIDLASVQIVKFVAFFPVTDQVLYACGIDNSTTAPFDLPRLLYKSEDGGQSWRKLPSTNFQAGSRALYFFDSQTGLSVNISMVQKTTDGGATWRTVFDTGSLLGLDKLQCFPNGTGYAAGGSASVASSYGTLLKTTDQGEHWQQLPWSYGDITTLSFLSDQVGFVGTLHGPLYRTNDGGATWQQIQGLPPSGSRGVFLTEQEGYITTAQTIEHTHDGGATWQVEHTLSSTDQFGYLGFSSTGVGIVFTNNGLIFKN